jgi:hypothetical protein
VGLEVQEEEDDDDDDEKKKAKNVLVQKFGNHLLMWRQVMRSRVLSHTLLRGGDGWVWGGCRKKLEY